MENKHFALNKVAKTYIHLVSNYKLEKFTNQNMIHFGSGHLFSDTIYQCIKTKFTHIIFFDVKCISIEFPTNKRDLYLFLSQYVYLFSFRGLTIYKF